MQNVLKNSIVAFGLAALTLCSAVAGNEAPTISGYVGAGAADRLDKQLTESNSKMVFVGAVPRGNINEVIKVRAVIKKHEAITVLVDQGCVDLCWPILSAGTSRFIRHNQTIGVAWAGDNGSAYDKANQLQIQILQELNFKEADIEDLAGSKKAKIYYFDSGAALDAGMVTTLWAGPIPQPEPEITESSVGTDI